MNINGSFSVKIFEIKNLERLNGCRTFAYIGFQINTHSTNFENDFLVDTRESIHVINWFKQ